jgi:hypothetical protein
LNCQRKAKEFIMASSLQRPALIRAWEVGRATKRPH